MKLNSNIKREKLSEDVIQHLEFIDTMNVKWSILGLVLTVYNLPLLISLLSIMKVEFLWILSPLIIILHIWGGRLLIKNTYSTQLETILFIGVFGIIGAVTSLIMVQGLSFYVLNISSFIYYTIINLTIVILSLILVKAQINTYSKTIFEKKERKKQSKMTGLLIAAPVLGYVIANLTGDTLVLKHYITLGMNLAIYFVYIYLATKFLHKYLFIKTNLDYVRFQRPNKKEMKKLTSKGVVIK